jgi:hypothetical protein
MVTEYAANPGATAEGLRSSLAAAVMGDLHRDNIAIKRAAERTRSLISTRALQAFGIDPQPQVNGAASVGEGHEWVSRPGILVGELSVIDHPALNAKSQFIARSVAVIEADGTISVYPDGYDDGIDFDGKRMATDDEVLRVRKSALEAVLSIANQTYNKGIVSLG